MSLKVPRRQVCFGKLSENEKSSSLISSLLSAESVYGAVPAVFGRHDRGPITGRGFIRCHQQLTAAPPERIRATWLEKH